MPTTSGRSTPVKLIRSSSLTTLPETDKRRKPKALSKKSYRGRMSAGAPIALKVEARRKSRVNYRQFEEDETEDYSYHTPTHSRVQSSSRLFNCLPVIDNQENISPVTSSRKISCMSNDIDWETDPNAVGDVDRKRLYNEFYSFLLRDSKTSNLVVNQPDVRNDRMFSFTVGGKQERHKFGDYLWLVLKAYFAGKDVRGQLDAAFIHDPKICKLREEKFSVLNRILDLRLEHLCSADEMAMTSENLSTFVEQRVIVDGILGDLDRFETLFPNRKAMTDVCCKRVNMEMVDHRISILYAWKNTADQLNDKIEQFGRMIGVDQSADGAAGWPRPLHRVAPINIESANGIVRAFVERSLAINGMKKVFHRVSSISEELVLRATILFQLPANSYAQAAGTKRTLIPMSDEMRDKYGEHVRGFLCSSTAKDINLPSLLPLFLFVLGVRVQMVLEWIGIRAQSKLPDGTEMDMLTLQTLVEDSRDCIEEAVRVKRHYLETVAYTCQDSNDLLPREYDCNLVAVFRNYLYFVCQLSAACTLTPSTLFTHLEKEWKAAWICAPYISGGIELLTQTFCNLLCKSIEEVVSDYFKIGVFKITKKEDSVENGESVEEECKEEGEIEVRRRRVLNSLVREAQERAARGFNVVRLMLTDVMTAACYIATAEYETVEESLKDHVLICPSNSHPFDWPVCLFCPPSNTRSVEEILRTVYEGHSPDGTHLVVLPVPFNDFVNVWRHATIGISVDIQVAEKLKGLRNDRVLVIGSLPLHLHKLYPSVFRLCSQNSAAQTHMHREMVTFASRLDCLSHDVWEQVCNVIGHRSFGEDDGLRASHSALLTMFNFTFQFHRDVGRVVWEVHELRREFAERCVRLLENWSRLVPNMDVRRAPHIPLWAKVAFNFMVHIAEPQWTQHMNDTVFRRLESVLEKSQKLVVGASENLKVNTSSRRTSERESGDSSPRSPPSSIQGRSERLRLAAIDADVMVEERRKTTISVGRVVQMKREDFTVSNYIDPKKKAPFRWQMLEKIGEGQFGHVYKALNVDQQCVIAVKQIKEKGQMLKVVAGEVDILRHLNHANLVKYYGIEVQGDDVLILMEFCAEGTLEKICREGMDMALVRRYANHLLHAVEYIHENKVIHRDIKPANIFLDLSCVLKLGDFGCSIRLREHQTVQGEFLEFVGTVNYMAPEMTTWGTKDENNQYRGYGRAVDIWSVGCVVLEMVTGRRPWDRASMHQIAFALGVGRKPDYPVKCPSILKELLDSCLEFDPDKRRSAAQLLNLPFVNVHVDTDPAQRTIDNRG